VGEGSFLRLLAADASVAEVERLAARIRRAAPEADHATLDGQLADALAVREMLERRARRERELGALYETAGDLSSLRDLDRVLVAIVRRARQLLGTDAAYLTCSTMHAATRTCGSPRASAPMRSRPSG
jgi:PAS domain-containing protein